MATDNTLPAPLVGPHVDLRGYAYMPLYCDRLFGSETWIKAPAEGKVAALRLWCHAFLKESPSASLPDDDILLSEYAGYGVAVSAWKKVKPAALRGWAMCSNGRLYHAVLATIAMDAWEARKKSRAQEERVEKHRAERSAMFEYLRERGIVLAFNVPIETLRETAKQHGWNVASNVTGDVTVGELGTLHVTGRSEVKRSEAKLSDLSDRDVQQTPNEGGSDPPNGKGAVEIIARSKAKNGSGMQLDNPAWIAATSITVNRPRREGESYEDWKDAVATLALQRSGGRAHA